MKLVWQRSKLVGQPPHQLNRKLHPWFQGSAGSIMALLTNPGLAGCIRTRKTKPSPTRQIRACRTNQPFEVTPYIHRGKWVTAYGVRCATPQGKSSHPIFSASSVSISAIYLLKEGGNTMFRWCYLHDHLMKTKGTVDKILFFMIKSKLWRTFVTCDNFVRNRGEWQFSFTIC